ncbi:MAG: signal transduction histidine kinase/ligand-binding sensor domain-containing protein [Rhodothermales bacterium]|jgi:signal transduction histidine kinase/ligand-binding sensor domain-containing protein
MRPFPNIVLTARHRFLGAALVVLVACSLASGEIQASDGTGGGVLGSRPTGSDELAQVQLDSWNVQHGLPLSAVDRVIQGKNGYLWLATQEGLVRFDGLDFKVYRKATSGLASNNIYSLHEDEDGTIWVGTRNGGLARYRDGRLESVEVAGLEHANIAAIVGNASTGLLLGLADSTVIHLEITGDAYKTKPLDALGVAGVTSLIQDDSGAIWIGTRERGLFRYGQGALTSFLDTGALTHTNISDMSLAPDGSVWVASNGEGIAHIQGYRIHTYGTEAGLPVDDVRSVLADPNGTVWIGTLQNGIWRLTEGLISQPQGLGEATSRDIRDLAYDREGSVWMATDKGLDRIRKARFKTYGQPEGLPSEYVQTTLEASDGSIWVGTDKGPARIRNGQVDARFDTVGDQRILSLAESADGSIWMGTFAGLYRYHDGVITHRTAEKGNAPNSAIYALHSGPSGVWMGTRLGVARLTDTGFVSMTTEDGLGSNDITAIHETVERDLWLGTYDAGLHLVRNGEVVAGYLDSAYVTAIHEDAEGDIWVGIREGGLVLVREGILYEFKTDHGMLSDNVLAILEDEDGGIWMTSNVGASRIDKSTLLDFAHGRISRLEPEVFTDHDGLRSSEFNGGTQPAAWMGSEGRLWLASAGGLVSVNPYQRNEVPPLVLLEHFSADKKERGVLNRSVLEPGAQRVDFDFTSPTFVATGKIRFAFMLDGYDRGWQNVEGGGIRAASYTNLAPGPYTFRVKAQNGDGVWSESEATLSFELLPFYWQTAWFKVLCILGIFALAAFLYHRRITVMRQRATELEDLVNERTKDLRLSMKRTEEALSETEKARLEAESQRQLAEDGREVIEQQAEKLREMDRIKTRFFNNISHEFRTPLTLNIGPMENALLGEYGEISAPMRRQVEVMLRNSRRLLRLINQLLDLSKLESGRMKLKVMDASLTDLVEGIVYSFTPFAEKKRLDLQFDDSGTVDQFLFDPLGLEKVFFNLLSNAVKFTPDDGAITVSVQDATLNRDGTEFKALAIKVRDTGNGIPEGDVAHIFDRFHQVDGTVSKVQEGTGIGLALVKELVELHGGTISVESVVGEGSEFQVLLPIDASLLGAHEVIVDGYATQPAQRGPMMEMSVFEETKPDRSVGGESAPANAPVVLVVDDSPDIREYVAECLQTRYQVVTAIDGQDGLEKARSLRPNLIVSDVMMPNLTGFEMCRAIRGDENIEHIPLLLVTSKASPEDKIEGLEAGANDYVAKPFSARELLARVENLIRVQDQKTSLQRLNSELLSSNAALRQASEMKSQLLSIASHDMKNPLTAIREFARILREESDQGHQIELLDMIFDSSNDMLALISQLLDSAEMEGGARNMNRQRADLVDLAERVVERNVRIADRKGQVIRTNMDDSEACSIPIDAERVREAMDNVLSNAIKYSPLQSSIYVSVKRKANEVHFSVRDEGPGLTNDDLGRVFGKFQKLSARPTGGESSTGLGLSIVKQIVELHGGRAQAEKNAERGSTFGFVLPDLTEDSADRPPIERRKGGTTPAPRNGETAGRAGQDAQAS